MAHFTGQNPSNSELENEKTFQFAVRHYIGIK